MIWKNCDLLNVRCEVPCTDRQNNLLHCNTCANLKSIESTDQKYAKGTVVRNLHGTHLSPSGPRAILETPPLSHAWRKGEGVSMISVKFEFRGVFCRLLIFLVSKERAPKQLKQISIVCKNIKEHRLEVRIIHQNISGSPCPCWFPWPRRRPCRGRVPPPTGTPALSAESSTSRTYCSPTMITGTF